MMHYQKVALVLVVGGGLALAGLFWGLNQFLGQSGSSKTASNPVSENQESLSQESEEEALQPLVVQEAQKPNDQLPKMAPTPQNQEQSASREQPVPQDQISERLELQSQYFFRCYSHLLEDNPDKKGQVVISFTINERGDVASSQIASTDFDNNVFHRCIKDVVDRTPFPSFDGESVSTLFPIVFE